MTPRNRFKMFVCAALTDARFTVAEESVLLRLAAGLGLDQAEAAKIVENIPLGRTSRFALPRELPDRKHLFQEMLNLLRADGEVSPAESRVLLRVAARFGFEPERVKDVLQLPPLQVREDQFRLLAGIALTNSRLGANVEDLLRRAGQGLGFSEERAAQLTKNVSEGGRVRDLKVPEDPAEREHLFRELIEMVVSDGQVSDGEVALLERLAPAFGVAPERVRTIAHVELFGDVDD